RSSTSTASKNTWPGRSWPCARRRGATRCSSAWRRRTASSSSRRVPSPARALEKKEMMVRKRTLWISGLAIACIAAAVVAALAAVPPNLGKAIEEQRRLISERPQDPAVYNDLGNLLILASRPEEAEEAYRKAVEIAPDRVSALFNLALLQQQRGELREALHLYRRVLEIQPQHAWAWYQIGTLYEHWRWEGRAVDAYANAFRIDPQLAFPEV